MGGSRRLSFSWAQRPGKANFEIRIPADLLHEIWLGHEKLSSAFFSGRIKTKGNVFKAASKLENLFRQAEAIYPDYVKKYGLAAA